MSRAGPSLDQLMSGLSRTGSPLCKFRHGAIPTRRESSPRLWICVNEYDLLRRSKSYTVSRSGPSSTRPRTTRNAMYRTKISLKIVTTQPPGWSADVSATAAMTMHGTARKRRTGPRSVVDVISAKIASVESGAALGEPVGARGACRSGVVEGVLQRPAGTDSGPVSREPSGAGRPARAEP